MHDATMNIQVAVGKQKCYMYDGCREMQRNTWSLGQPTTKPWVNWSQFPFGTLIASSLLNRWSRSKRHIQQDKERDKREGYQDVTVQHEDKVQEEPKAARFLLAHRMWTCELPQHLWATTELHTLTDTGAAIASNTTPHLICYLYAVLLCYTYMLTFFAVFGILDAVSATTVHLLTWRENHYVGRWNGLLIADLAIEYRKSIFGFCLRSSSCIEQLGFTRFLTSYVKAIRLYTVAVLRCISTCSGRVLIAAIKRWLEKVSHD
eukprot:1194967-Prorocentrum_minimum.AAC.3